MSENWTTETGPAGNMIYHYPLGLSEQVSGSQVHIQQMMRGFREAGYAVAPVLGGSDARGRAWARLRAEFHSSFN